MTLIFSFIGGLLIAVALQLVLANLGIALGLTVLDWSPAGGLSQQAASELTEKGCDEPLADSVDADQSPQSGRSWPVTHLLGFGVAAGFSTVIFVATLVAVAFTELTQPQRGLIYGLYFWAAYWILFIWLSSTTIAGITDSLLGSALEGGKQLLSTLKKATDLPGLPFKGAAIGESDQSPSVEQSMLQDLVQEVSDLASTQKELPTLLANQRAALLADICHRTNLSTQAAETLVEELDQELDQERDQALKTDRELPVATPSIPAVPTASRAKLLSQLNLPSWQQVLRRTLNQVDLSDWDFETLLSQSPISANDIQRQASQLVESAIAVLPDESSQVQETTEAPTQPNNQSSLASTSKPLVSQSITPRPLSPAGKAVQTKIISYCRYTNTDALTPEKLIEKVTDQREKNDLASDSAIENMPLDTEEIAAVLSRRKKLSKSKQQQLLDALAVCWPFQSASSQPAQSSQIESLSIPYPQVADSSSETTEKELSIRGVAEEAYGLLSDKINAIDWSKTTLEDIKPEVNLLLEQLERDNALRSIDWGALSDRLQLPAHTRADLTAWIQAIWASKLQALQPIAKQNAQQLSQQLANQITHFLKHQDKSELEPTKISQSLKALVRSTVISPLLNSLTALSHPSELADQSGISDLFDSKTWDSVLWNKHEWQQALEARKDLSLEEIQQILDWGEKLWQPKAKQVGHWLKTAKREVGEHLSTCQSCHYLTCQTFPCRVCLYRTFPCQM